MRLAKLLKLYRAAHGMDQKAMAAEMDIATSTMSRIEQGKTISMTQIIKVLVWLLGN